METKKTSSNAKTERLRMIRARSAARRAAITQEVQVEEALGKREQDLKATSVDEKSLRSVSQLTGFLTIGVLFVAISLIVQIWATLRAKFVFTPISFLYIVFSLVLIAALVWCIRLLNQKRVLSLWVYVGFMTLYILYTMAFRWFDGKDLFMQRDFITWIVLAAILFELYRLKRKNVLVE